MDFDLIRFVYNTGVGIPSNSKIVQAYSTENCVQMQGYENSLVFSNFQLVLFSTVPVPVGQQFTKLKYIYILYDSAVCCVVSIAFSSRRRSRMAQELITKWRADPTYTTVQSKDWDNMYLNQYSLYSYYTYLNQVRANKISKYPYFCVPGTVRTYSYGVLVYISRRDVSMCHTSTIHTRTVPVRVLN